MKLFGRKPRRPAQPEFDAPLRPDVPFYAVGDLHGCDQLFQRLLDKLNAAAHPEARLVTVGDYVDRGDDSRMVLRRLHHLSSVAGEYMVCLLGNHERMMLNALDDPLEEAPRWLRHGGLQTLASYRIAAPGRLSGDSAWFEMAEKLRHAIGEEILAWLRGLPLIWQTGNVAVVHAAADPRWALDAQDPDCFLWGHPEFRKLPRQDGTWIVHGHNIVDAPVCAGGVISIDTGAYATGRLTAALVQQGGVEYVTA